MNHPIFAEPPSGFIPMAADAVKQSVLERFFRGMDAEGMPYADRISRACDHSARALAHRSVRFDKRDFWLFHAHDSHMRLGNISRVTLSLNTRRSATPTKSCSPLAGKSRGANSTHPHERHCEAPLREARLPRPIGRVLRRLSRPLKIRSFLVGLGRCDAKVIVLPLCHTLLQIRLQTAFLTSLASDCNPPRAKVCQTGFKMQTPRGSANIASPSDNSPR